MSPTEFELSDTDLVHRVQAGEKNAFDEIDRRYRGPLNRFLLRYALGAEHADELCQQTLLRAFQMIGQLRSAESLAGWLHRIAFRLAAAEGRRRKTVSLDSSEYIEPAIGTMDRVSCDEERRNLWQNAKKHLTEDEYQALWLRYREEYPLSEIAEKIDKKEGAVRVLLHRARKKLLKTLKEIEQ